MRMAGRVSLGGTHRGETQEERRGLGHSHAVPEATSRPALDRSTVPAAPTWGSAAGPPGGEGTELSMGAPTVGGQGQGSPRSERHTHRLWGGGVCEAAPDQRLHTACPPTTHTFSSAARSSYRLWFSSARFPINFGHGGQGPPPSCSRPVLITPFLRVHSANTPRS